MNAATLMRPKNVKPTVRRGPFKDKGFWQLEKYGVTAGALALFKRCHEQFYLTYVEGYSSRAVPEHLEFGNCIHWILEQCYRRGKFPSHNALVELMAEYEEHWTAQTPAPTQIQLDQQQKVYGMAQAALPAYFMRWDGDISGKYKFGHKGAFPPHEWVVLEETFEHSYVYPDGFTVPLRGRMDGVYLNKAGKLLVFDTKTKGQINEESIADTLKLNFQMMLYLHVARQKYGNPIGVTMNLFRRPQIKQGKDQSLLDYFDRIRRDTIDIDRLDFYFLRIQLAVGLNEIDQWVATRLDPTMEALRMWYEGKAPHVPDDEQLTAYGQCQMYHAILHNDYKNLYKRPSVFPELPEVQ